MFVVQAAIYVWLFGTQHIKLMQAGALNMQYLTHPVCKRNTLNLMYRKRKSTLCLFFPPHDTIHSLHGLPHLLRGNQNPGHLGSQHMKPDQPMRDQTSGLSCHSQHLDFTANIWRSCRVFKGTKDQSRFQPSSQRDSNHKSPATPDSNKTQSSCSTASESDLLLE